MIEKAYIVVVTEEQRPAVARVHVIGSQGDWRLVQSAPYRREGGGASSLPFTPATCIARGSRRGERRSRRRDVSERFPPGGGNAGGILKGHFLVLG